MWSSAQLKYYAKNELRVSYWISFAVCLVGGMLTGGSVSGINSSLNSGMRDMPVEVQMVIVVIILGVSLLAIAFAFFVSNPIMVGTANFFYPRPVWRPQFWAVIFRLQKRPVPPHRQNHGDDEPQRFSLVVAFYHSGVHQVI